MIDKCITNEEYFNRKPPCYEPKDKCEDCKYKDKCKNYKKDFCIPRPQPRIEIIIIQKPRCLEDMRRNGFRIG